MLRIPGFETGLLLYESPHTLVFRSQRESSGQLVVLKILKNAHPTSAQITRFREEFDLIQSLNLPGVVRAYSLERFSGRMAMVLEDFGAQPLTWLAARHSLGLEESLDVAISLAKTLGSLHELQITHLDLQPANILYEPKSRQVKLIDFALSTRQPRVLPRQLSPQRLADRLPYLSPEQTGWMNRAVDSRSDLYSLGVILYELLTGRLPVEKNKPDEMIRHLVAGKPASPCKLNPQIPGVVGDIVVRLLEKEADDRYQSAWGLSADLEACRQGKLLNGKIEAFAIGKQDLPKRFFIPQKLFGRQAEIEGLRAAYDRARRGQQEILMVAGRSGVGKTRLALELKRHMAGLPGLFAAGKFSAGQSRRPYAGIVEALYSLLKQVLEGEDGFSKEWKSRLNEALGTSGQVLLEVLPELEIVTGPLPPAPALGPVEAQNRFSIIFRRFLQTFTAPGHPLVLFLDDLQGADGASLRLLQALLNGDLPNFLLIGAYRENEVTPTHALARVLEEARLSGIPVKTLHLASLTLEETGQLVAAAFRRPEEEARPLAASLHAKTGGSPLFLHQLLPALLRGGQIYFNAQTRRWHGSLSEIQDLSAGNNEGEFLAQQAAGLDADTQSILRAAACITATSPRNRFNLEQLAPVCGCSDGEAARRLQPAIDADLVLPFSPAYLDEGQAGRDAGEYCFAHESIQRAVWNSSGSNPQELGELSWRTGQARLSRNPRPRLNDSLFAIVDALNDGYHPGRPISERHRLVELNLQAAERARLQTAYQPALCYLLAAIELAGPRAWERTAARSFEMHLRAVECAYLSGDYERMEVLAETARLHTQDVQDRAQIEAIRLKTYAAQGRAQEAVEAARPVLRELGAPIPEHPSPLQTAYALLESRLALAGKRIEDLPHLRPVSDPVLQKTLAFITLLADSAGRGAPDLLPLLAFKSLGLMVRNGLTPGAPVIFARYGMALCGMPDEIESGLRFGQIALQMLADGQETGQKSQVLYLTAAHILPWKEPSGAVLEQLRQAHLAGLENGDLEHAFRAAADRVHYGLLSGRDLNELAAEADQAAREMRSLGQVQALDRLSIDRQAIAKLSGVDWRPAGAASPWGRRPRSRGYTREAETRWAQALHRLVLHVLNGEYLRAVEDAAQAGALLTAVSSRASQPAFYFYDALARLNLVAAAPLESGEAHLRRVNAALKKLKRWAELAPHSHQHRVALLEAERLRVLGRESEAREAYDQAIIVAHAAENRGEEALACELAGRFYQNRSQPRLARHYLGESCQAYQRWGAPAQAARLERFYPETLFPDEGQPAVEGLPEISAPDLERVVLASQALSGELEPARLYPELVRISAENAGAQYGALLLEENGRWRVKGQWEAGPPAAGREDIALVSGPARSVIQAVLASQEMLLLADAAQEGEFGQDPAIQQRGAKSVLCLPVKNQGQITGILYLENTQEAGAFSADRVQGMLLLASQAAISIENCRQYAQQVELAESYRRFVPPETLRVLKKDKITQVQPGDHLNKEMAVMFSDLRAFNSLSALMGPQETFALVNTVLQRVSPEVQNHQGMIVKYLGDGLMAVFPECADDALQAGVGKLRQMAILNREREQRGEAPVPMGIGVHFGQVMVGIVGGTAQLQAEALSVNVDLAERLEGLTKFYGVNFLISQETVNHLADPGRYHLRLIDRVKIKGRQEGMVVYEVYDADPPEIIRLKNRTRRSFEQGVQLYHEGDFTGAAACMQSVLEHSPRDSTAQFYLDNALQHRLEGGRTRRDGEGWPFE